MVPMTKLLNVHFAGAELMTGLPEYRNGGLLVDTGLLTLKPDDVKRGLETYHRVTPASKATEVVPTFEPSDDVVVEWRAVTVGFLDELLAAVNRGLGIQLSLAQMLEAGTWKVSIRLLRFVDFRSDSLLRAAERLLRYLDPSPKVLLLVSSAMARCSDDLFYNELQRPTVQL